MSIVPYLFTNMTLKSWIFPDNTFWNQTWISTAYYNTKNMPHYFFHILNFQRNFILKKTHVFWEWRQCKINECLSISLCEWVQLLLLLNGFPSQDQIYSMTSLICRMIFGLLMTQLFQLVDNGDAFLKNTHTMFANYNQCNWCMWSVVCV